MPMPRYHGGAPLQHYPLNAPAFRGVNRQARNAVLGPEWATRLENTVLDTQSRVAARKGWATLTSVAAGADFRRVVEFNNGGTMELLAVNTAGSAIYKSADGGSTFTNVTGTAGITDPDGQFLVFNDKVLYLQSGDGILIYTGTTFSDLAAASEPTGGVGVVFAGRVWAVDSTGIAVKYCALLDETDWTGTDTGTFDMTSVWGDQDSITALASFNGALVIFGQRHIVLYTDGAGSALGIDPLQAYIADTVDGIGCIARDTVVNVKGDLWFLDDTGVQSLGRLIAERSNPLVNVSTNVQDEIKAAVGNVTTNADIRAAYSPRDRFYLLSCPVASGSAESGVAFCFDTRGQLEDGSYRCSGIWNQLVPTAMVVLDSTELVMTLRTVTGELGRYFGYTDNSDPYVVEYESGWTDLNSPDLKILKRLNGLLYVQTATSVTFKWAFDFDSAFKTSTSTFQSSGTVAEYGVAEYGIAEWGGGVKLQEKKVGGRGTGEYIKVGMTITINGSEVAMQQVSLYAKQGRIR